MSETGQVYGSSNIASRIAGDLAEHDVIADIGVVYISPSTSSSEFTVTVDSGQRFKVTVQEQ